MTASWTASNPRDRETSPLLLEDANCTDTQRRTTNPLPRAQLATIYGIKLVVPISGTQTTPYILKMVARMNLPGGGSVGYYSGLLAAAHTLGQMLTIFFWGRLSGRSLFALHLCILPTPYSDHMGRTRVIAIGMTGLGIVTLTFGLTSTFFVALFNRLLCMLRWFRSAGPGSPYHLLQRAYLRGSLGSYTLSSGSCPTKRTNRRHFPYTTLLMR